MSNFHYECRDCPHNWMSCDDLLRINGHALSKEHRVVKITVETYVDGRKDKSR